MCQKCAKKLWLIPHAMGLKFLHVFFSSLRRLLLMVRCLASWVRFQLYAESFGMKWRWNEFQVGAEQRLSGVLLLCDAWWNFSKTFDTLRAARVLNNDGGSDLKPGQLDWKFTRCRKTVTRQGGAWAERKSTTFRNMWDAIFDPKAKHGRCST